MKFTVFYWVLLGLLGFNWLGSSSQSSLPSFTGFYGVLIDLDQVLNRVYRVLPSFTEFYRVLLGFTGFYWVLPGFHWLGSSSQWSLPSFTEFYQVLLGFSGF